MTVHGKIAVLTERLGRLRNFILADKFIYGISILLAACAGAFLIANLTHWLFYLPIWFRISYLILAAAVLLGFLIKLLIMPLLSAPSIENLALLVEKRYPDLKNRLIAALQLEKKLLDNRENYSPALIQKCIDQAEELSGQIDFKASYVRRLALTGVRAALIGGILTLALWLFWPALFNSSLAVFAHPLREIPRELDYRLAVVPQSREVLKFDNLDLHAIVYGSHLPAEARLFWRAAEEWRSEVLRPEAGPVRYPEFTADSLPLLLDTLLFTQTFKEIRHDFEYYFEAGAMQSEVYRIRVVDKPRLNNIRLTYFFPRYTGLAPAIMDENDGNIQALKGTRVKIEADLNKPVALGRIVFAAGDTMAAALDGPLLSGTIEVREAASYHIEIIDSLGHSNPDPIEYRVAVIEDNYPEVRLVKPGGNIDLDDYLAFDLSASLSDDFGFSRLVLHYLVHLSPTEISADSIEFKFDRARANQMIDYYWDLSGLGLYPGSFVEYYFEVFDNDYISGPKSAVSQTYSARHPSIDEMLVDIEEAREEVIGDLMEALREEQELQENIKQLREDLQFKDELDWETKKDIEQVQDRQQNLIEQFDRLLEQYKQTNEQARENDLLNLEMIQKLAELQKLFEEVATPEMKEAMQKMAEALEQLDKKELERAMEEMQMTTEEVLKNIERAIAQLKRFQIDQKMQAMLAMAEKLLENQNDVNQKTSEAAREELPPLKNREDRNREDLNKLRQEAKDLRELLKENSLSEDPSAGQFCSAVEESDADQDMQKMSADLERQEQESALQFGQISSDKLEAMLSRMKNAQAQFNNEMSQEMAEKMRRMVDDLLYLSDSQEKLFNEVSALQPHSPQMDECAQRQSDLKSEAERIRSELQEIAKQSAFIQSSLDKYMNNACQAMGNSISSLSNRSTRAAAIQQNEGIYSLNQSAQSLIEALNSESQCNSSCNSNQSMFKKMKKLSQGQNKINRETQSQCNNPSENPGKPNPDALRRLAVQQSKIRQGISEMIDEFGQRKDVPGRLDKMAEEMKKVIESLEKGEAGPGLLERQKNIYSRMLDFQLSLERRDYAEQRQAERGEDVVRSSPQALEAQQKLQESAFRTRLEKFLEEPFPPEYEALVKDYLKALMQSQE